MLVIAAERFELNSMPRRPGWEFVANGPGPQLAAAAVRVGFDAVLSAGICGALDPALRVGDIVVANAVNGIPIAVANGPEPKRVANIASLDRVIGTVEEKKELFRSGAVAIEMEAAGVLQRAQELGMPCFCVKAVSDVADEAFALDLNAARDRSGRFSVARILGQAVRRPVTVGPELLRLRRNSARAAKALGDFLEHCGL